jgi:hypothetical protein
MLMLMVMVRFGWAILLGNRLSELADYRKLPALQCSSTIQSGASKLANWVANKGINTGCI